MLQFAEKFFFRRRQLTRIKLLNAKQTHTVSTILDDGLTLACAARFASTAIFWPSRVIAGLRHSP